MSRTVTGTEWARMKADLRARSERRTARANARNRAGTHPTRPDDRHGG